MEEEILKILTKHLTNEVESTPWYNAAKDIGEDFKRFMEWVRQNCSTAFMYSVSDKLWVVDNEIESIYYDENGLYKYWIEHIKDK